MDLREVSSPELQGVGGADNAAPPPVDNLGLKTDGLLTKTSGTTPTLDMLRPDHDGGGQAGGGSRLE
jgi:hypothetical protein